MFWQPSRHAHAKPWAWHPYRTVPSAAHASLEDLRGLLRTFGSEGEDSALPLTLMCLVLLGG